MNGDCSLTLQDMRVDFAPRSPAAPGHGYGISVRADDGAAWRAISAATNPLVGGASFNLFPDHVGLRDDRTIALSGSRRVSGGEYHYSGTVEADPGSNWFRFNIEIESDRPIALAMTDGFEPEIMLDLGPLPPYERGDHVWFMTCVNNPTMWNDNARGNDMPATYLYDAYL